MGHYLIFIVTILTSCLIAWVGTAWVGLTWKTLRGAVIGLLESIGLTILFFGVNVILGVALILFARKVNLGFPYLYVMDDAALLVLSALQATLLAWWLRIGSIRIK